MWIGFLVVLIASVVITIVGWLGWQERLPRGYFAGIRTPYTMANDEQWKAVHRFGAPYMIFGGIAAFAGSLALFPFAVFGSLPDEFAAAALFAMALVVGGTGLMSWYLGVRGAKAYLANRSSEMATPGY